MKSKIIFFILAFIFINLIFVISAKDFIIYNSTNQSQNYFVINGTTTNITASGNISASWLIGIFNWIVGNGASQNYLAFNGTQLTFNDTFLNGTIDKRVASNLSGFINGSGTYGYIPMWNGTTSLNNSVIYQNGSNIGINTNTPSYPLDVNGNIGVNNLYFKNPGIGNSSIIQFLKTNDQAWINVTEILSDQTTYGFYMADNPDDSTDKFLWQINDFQGTGGNWQPLLFSGLNATIRAANINAYGNYNIYGPWYSSNGIQNTIRTSVTGTLNLTPNVNGFTGNTEVFWIVINGTGSPNTFDWGSGQDEVSGSFGTLKATNVSITGSSQTLENGVTITFNATTGGVHNDLWQFRVSSGGHLLTSNGSVSSPAISFTGDTGTGIYLPSIDTLGIATAGVSRLTINSNGNTAIGPATSFNYPGILELSHPNNSVVQLAWQDSTGATTYGYINNTLITGAYGEPLSLGSNDTERLRVLAGGNIGINTTTPQNTLNVLGDINGTGTVFTSNINLTTIAGYALNATSNGISWATATNGTLATWAEAVNGTLINTLGNQSINTTSGYFNITNQTNSIFFVNGSTGNIGIGTNAPGFKVDIEGIPANSTNGFHIQAADSHWLRLFPSLGSQNYNGIVQAGDAGIIFSNGTQGNGSFVIAPWSTGGITSGIRINQNGNVVLNTSTPQNALNVLGDINSTTSVFAQSTKNLSIGYDYATNGTYNTNSTSPFTANYSNFSSIYGYALNSSLWTLNYSNFSVVYGYAVNGSGSSNWNANYSNYFKFNDTNNSVLIGGSTGNPLNSVTTLGYQSGSQNTGILLTGVGYQAGSLNTANQLTAIGYQAGYNNSGILSTFVGYNAGQNNSGSSSTGIGAFTLKNNLGGNAVALGYQAGFNNTGANVELLGYQAGYLNHADGLNAIGLTAGYNNGGSYSNFQGVGAGYQNIGGSSTGIGNNALYNNTGTSATSLGGYAGYNNTGTYLTALGLNSGYNNSGNYSTGLGGTTLINNTGNDVLAIGYGAGINNQISNQFIVQDTNINSTNPLIQGNFSSGRVGIGTTTPQNILNVLGDINATTSIFAQGKKNLSIGYDYATNGTLLSSANLAGFVNGSGTYGYIPAWNGTTSINNSVIYQNGSNISIGTTNSGEKLVIAGLDGQDSIRILSTSLTDSAGIGYNVGGSHYNGVSLFASPNGGGGMVLTSWSNGETAIGRTYAKYEDSNGSNPDGLIVQGNTGIGTILPQNTLNVVGGFNVSNLSNVTSFFVNESSGYVGIGTSTPQQTLNVVGNVNITGNLSVGGSDTSFEVYNNGTTIVFDTKGNNSFFTDNASANWVTGRNGLCIGTDCRTSWASVGEPNWNANYSNFSTLYGNLLNNISSNFNATNFSVVYGYALNATSNGISWATANNGTLATWANVVNGTVATWANAVNGTLMLQSNWNATNTSYLTIANWNATNTSYYLTSNPSAFYNATQQNINLNISSYLNITNQTNSTFFINASNGYVGIGTTSPATALEITGSSTAEGPSIDLYNSNTGWGSGPSLQFSSLANSKKVVSKITSTLVNNSGSNANSALGFYISNNTTSPSLIEYIAPSGYVGIGGITTPQNTLNVLGDINATTSVFSQNKNLSIGYDYATNGTFTTGGISWATATNGTLATWANVVNGSVDLNNTFEYITGLQENGVANFNGTINLNGSYVPSWANITNGTLMLQSNWNATNTSYDLASNPNGYYNSTQKDINFNITNYLNITNQTNSAFFVNATTELIGIGTTSPSAPLEIYNKTAGLRISTQLDFEDALYLKNNNPASATSPNIALENGQATKIFIRMGSNNSLVILNDSGVSGAQIGLNGSNTYFNPTGGNFGIGTSNPQNALNVAGGINSTTSVFAQSTKNLSIGYDYATNGTYNTNATSPFTANYSNFSVVYGYTLNNSLSTGISWATATNGTLATWANAVNGTLALSSSLANWTSNYSNFSTIYGNQLGNISSNFNATNFSVVYGYTLNNSLSTGISWATATNGTLATWANAVNGTLALSSSLANWTSNYSNFSTIYGNQLGNISSNFNATNFSVVYGYTLNNSLSTGISWATATNGTLATWANAVNGTLALSSSLANWTSNYSNFSTIYGNQLGNISSNFNATNFSVVYGYTLNNSLSSGISWATATNGTLATWANAVNGTLALSSSLANWTSNYSNFSTIYGNQLGNISSNFNATNFSVVYGYTLNNSLSSGISWATAYNGTLAKTDATNTFGNFNQTFNGTTLFLWALKNSVGIGTTTPQNILNVIGDINATTSIFSQNKNLSIGYDYATNGSYIASNNVTYGYSLNGSSNWNANYTNVAFENKLNNFTANQNLSTQNVTFTNGTSGGRICLNQACTSYITNNGTGILIQG